MMQNFSLKNTGHGSNNSGGNRNKKKRCARKIITKEARIIKLMRESRKFSLKQAGQLLGVSSKTVGHFENGRINIDCDRLKTYIEAYKYTWEEFEQIKNMRLTNSLVKFIKKSNNKNGNGGDNDNEERIRRSYQKQINKECKVLQSLRKMKKISQYEASELCGYSKCTIGHIENGRIELPSERIRHIVKSYGHSMDMYNGLMSEDILRDELIDRCIQRMINLDGQKLRIVSSLLDTI